MTVSSETSRKTFTGNGSTTSFATSPMVFFDSDDLEVYVVTTATGAATLLTENTHYTVSGGDGSTGTVDTSAGSSPYGAPSASQTLVIVRNLDIVQETDFAQNDPSDAEVAEDALDRIVMLIQQLDRRIDGAFRLPDSDVSGADAELPTPEALALIGWNSAGTALVNYAAGEISDEIAVTSYAETLLDDATASEARTTLGLGTMATQAASAVAITGGSVTGITDLAIADGGTGASTAANAFAALKQAATTGATGVVELATQAEHSAGTASVVPTSDLYDITLGTMNTTTGGTSIAFDDVIPAGARRVKVMITGLSTSGTSALVLRIGPSSGVVATGYVSCASLGGASALTFDTTGVLVNQASVAARTYNGTMTFDLVDAATNRWQATGIFATEATTGPVFCTGYIALAGALSDITLTTLGGSDTFDANGGVNVSYER